MRRLSRLAILLVAAPLLFLACSATPDAVDDTYAVQSGQTLTVPAFRGVLANDTDAEGEPLTAVLDTPPPYGTLDLRPDGSFTYFLAAGAGTVRFTYQTFDGFSRSAPAQVTITIDAVPTATADSWVVVRPGPLSVAAPGILANDSDPGGNAIRPHIVDLPAHGTLRSFPDGSFTYRPANGFVGLDSFTYEATDGVYASPVVTVSLYVVNTNGAPTGQPDAYTIYENSPASDGAPGVLRNDSDPDGHPIRAELVSEPAPVDNFELRPDGSFDLTPTLDWDTDITFRYRVTDGNAYSAPITVTIDIIAINNPPVGENDDYELAADQTSEIPAPGVLANDSDPVEFDNVTVFDLVSGPDHGELDLRANGSFAYTPEPGFTGVDSFAYRPGDSATNPGNVTNVSLTITAA